VASLYNIPIEDVTKDVCRTKDAARMGVNLDDRGELIIDMMGNGQRVKDLVLGGGQHQKEKRILPPMELNRDKGDSIECALRCPPRKSFEVERYNCNVGYGARGAFWKGRRTTCPFIHRERKQ